MAAKKTLAIVVKTSDWSETSRIATLWTRELGRVRVLAKGGRRLKSSFESALDLLTVCSIVLLRKSAGSLDLLTEAQVVERFPRLRTNLPAREKRPLSQGARKAWHTLHEAEDSWKQMTEPSVRDLLDEPPTPAVAVLGELTA